MVLVGGSSASIATVDISPLLVTSSDPRAEDKAPTAGKLVAQACETHGLLFVTGHGITAGKRQLAFDNARRFFSLPIHIKENIPATKGGFTRGYIGFGGESGSHRLECKEAFSYGYPWPEDEPPRNALQGANIWPDTDDLGEDWKEGMLDLFRLMVSVNEAIARGLSLALGLVDEDDQDLSRLCKGGDTISLMRLFHYFPYENSIGKPQERGNAVRAADQEKIGSSPHTDWGFSTSILQDGAGGLQFLERESQTWVDVPCSDEDVLVVNCGDYLSLLTKGRLKSPVHQVVSTGEERTSFVFFYYPNFDATLPDDPDTDTGKGYIGDGSTKKKNDTEKNPASAAKNGSSSAGYKATYNTLMDLKEAEVEAAAVTCDGSVERGTAKMSFGQYLARKWGGVFRG